MSTFNGIYNWTEECDECGEAHSVWYDFGTTVLCQGCLREHIAWEGKCEICGTEEADAYYKVNNQCVCDECVEDLRRS